MKKVMLIFGALLLLEGCSMLVLVKDCAPVTANDKNGGNKFACYTLKPLE